MLAAAATGGWIVGLVALAVLLLGCLLWAAAGAYYGITEERPIIAIGNVVAAGVAALVIIGVWWWCSAFTTSGDYHAWNVKEGTAAQISKRLVPAGEKSMMERYVVKLDDGRTYGIDDTRASLLKVGQHVRLLCKKDYQFGVDRDLQGWACRWGMRA